MFYKAALKAGLRSKARKAASAGDGEEKISCDCRRPGQRGHPEPRRACRGPGPRPPARPLSPFPAVPGRKEGPGGGGGGGGGRGRGRGRRSGGGERLCCLATPATNPAPGSPNKRAGRGGRPLLSRHPRVAGGRSAARRPRRPGAQASGFLFKMEVDINGESRSVLATLPLPIAEVSATGKTDSEKPRCSSTPCSPMHQTVSGYQILHMDSNYLVGFTTGEELLKLAQKCTVGEEKKVEAVVPALRSKQLDSGLSRSSRMCKARSRYYQPYEIPAINGRRRRRMPSSGDKCNKPVPYEPYKAFHGPLPLCLFKGKRAHSKSLDYLNLDRMNIKEPADTEVLQYQLQHLTLRGDRMFARSST